MTTISAEKVNLSFARKKVLHGASLKLFSGELVGLVGPNGAGKTSLLRVMAGLVKATKGLVRLNRFPLNEWSRKEVAQRIGYLPQSAHLAWPLNVYQTVALGRIPHLNPWQGPTGQDRSFIKDILVSLRIDSFAERSVDELSSGERSRVMLARALVGNPDLLLADEPIASLDPYYQLETMDFLRRQIDRGMGAIVTIHDLTLATRYCDRIVVLAQGVVEDSGPPKSVLTAELMRRLYSIEAEISNSDPDYVLPMKTVDRSEAKAS